MNCKYFLPAIIFASLSIVACQNDVASERPKKYSNIEAPALDLIHKCIAAHGGIDKWNALSEMSYTKNFVLFDEAGVVERMVTQEHSYILGKDKSYKISWKENKDQDVLSLVYENGSITKTKNGTKEEVDETSLNNSLQSSLYVIGLPYKLLDKGPIITYEGIEKAWNGRDAHVIKAVYDPKNGSNLTTSDIWWFLIDKENFKMIGNRITHLDHHNMIKNATWNELDGFVFYKERESRRIDENNKDLFLRATYLYENFSIK